MDSPFTKKEKVFNLEDSRSYVSYYEAICDTMKNNNVPNDRIPSFEHFMSKAFSCLNIEKVENWVNNYIENEKIEI
jgi:hypothetical protein